MLTIDRKLRMSAHADIKIKKPECEKLLSDTEVFLASGGEVETVAPEVTKYKSLTLTERQKLKLKCGF